MKKDTLEHLSSLMDGELSQETSLFVMRRLDADPELGGTWERYHLIRECLRRPGGRWSAAGLSVDIDRWHATATAGAVTQPGVRRWLKPVSGFAIAASVALLAVLTVAPEQSTDAPAAAASLQPFVSPNSVNISLSSLQSQAASYESNERLNAYLLRHNQVAGSVGRQGFVALVPIVTNTPVQVLDPAIDVKEEPEPTEVTATENRP